MDQLIGRMDRLEKKIDSVYDTLISLARTDENVVMLMEKNDVLETKITSLQKRTDTLENWRWALMGAAVVIGPIVSWTIFPPLSDILKGLS